MMREEQQRVMGTNRRPVFVFIFLLLFSLSFKSYVGVVSAYKAVNSSTFKYHDRGLRSSVPINDTIYHFMKQINIHKVFRRLCKYYSYFDNFYKIKKLTKW